jgi:hypothetical protein
VVEAGQSILDHCPQGSLENSSCFSLELRVIDFQYPLKFKQNTYIEKILQFLCN